MLMEREQSEAVNVKGAHKMIQELVSQLERQKKSTIVQAFVKGPDALGALKLRFEVGGVLIANGHGGNLEVTKDPPKFSCMPVMGRLETILFVGQMTPHDASKNIALREASKLSEALKRINACVDIESVRIDEELSALAGALEQFGSDAANLDDAKNIWESARRRFADESCPLGITDLPSTRECALI
ncbi:hypothetical protein CYLTODRAFT_458548 [Cylindrobasidium torrendii FP15055 ss-10]|uniref:Uncharacterized protein n=1 Tax=Cylindrobasidium torrendii FP15055 ss-10 TaxID=1314674 RepID=A0A0D7AYH8_9AGAR|nr:hypothetical protein CYLTODRAFT_458548 [Cylindrobasidium torrendii FP15055 ss-10]